MTAWRLYPGLPFLTLLVVAALAHPDTGYSCNPPETFEEKLDRMVEYDDSDGDGVVSAKDIDRSLILYDNNLDGVVSPYEFVKEWTCRYGDQPDVAHRIFNQLTQGFSLLLFEPSRNSANQTVAEFRESLYSFYTEKEIRGT
ncbi:uncharacterized protein LOC124147763 [Haliotis rufescens]|uniref:uncharacterized protein LOC124147763 n=1 Tax=Haliotis rufescens TaxID=6454 RepID=UPI001EAFE752|nr:uncharacterized protein LOC124147763 [Haliotis rufescens]XP_046374476.1 uncharacterized protein LOC124147763 [Haliotis rufescens]